MDKNKIQFDNLRITMSKKQQRQMGNSNLHSSAEHLIKEKWQCFNPPCDYDKVEVEVFCNGY